MNRNEVIEMFIVLRKSNLILALCVILVLGYSVSLWVTRGDSDFASGNAEEEAVATFATPASGRVIVIDAGHGG